MASYKLINDFQVPLLGIILATNCVGFTGCTVPWMKKEAPTELEKQSKAVEDVLKSEDRPRLISDASVILGVDLQEYEGYGLVNGLMDTGGDVKPSPQRDFILRELRANGVESPNQVLNSKSTALVRLKAFAPPGCNRGDTSDVVVELSDQCEATSLRNGWLMPARIQEMQLLGGAVRSSDLKARGQGSLVILPTSVTKDESVNVRKAVILGGATLVDNRRFSLRIRPSVRHVTTAAAMSRSINDRYYVQDGNERKGVATAKNDGVIQLEIPGKYRPDVQHYTDLLGAIAFLETSEELVERIEKCKRLMNEPTTSRQACLELEAIGKDAIPILAESLNHADDEIRFYVAYSLAHLDHPPAVAVLADLARKVPEFRPLCLSGLQIMEHYSAKEQLEELLQDPEPEVRYGALLALRKRNPRDWTVAGTQIGQLTRLVTIPSDHARICFSLEESPEVVIFGNNPGVYMDHFYEVNPRMTMKTEPNGQIRIVRFQPNDEDLVAIVAPDLTSVIEGFRSVGGTYNDLLCWMEDANRHHWIPTELSLNPRPHAGRVYHRNGEAKGTGTLVKNQSSENSSGGKDTSFIGPDKTTEEPREAKSSNSFWSWWSKK